MSDLLHSAEIRWFFQGRLPHEFLAWFTARKEIVASERMDSYLLFPGCESVGVKQREGRFEIKAIRGASETMSLGNSISGRSDAWVKWSYGGEGIDHWIASLSRETGGWLPVKKKRWLRKFSLDNKQPAEVEIRDTPLEGCGIEVTVVHAHNTVWWTFGLEGFGAEYTVRSNLRLAAEEFFSDNKPPRPLTTTSSCSYPVWINSFFLGN